MNNELLKNFDQFFQKYQTNWGNGFLSGIREVLSPEFSAREIYRSEDNYKIQDYGYSESVEGWRQAFDNFSDKKVEWQFVEETKMQLRDDEVLVMFWVWPVINGKDPLTAHLYTNTFKKQKEWTLLRSYIEASVPISDRGNGNVI
ncbi:hypothetical protein [Alkalihalobacillus sp. AL-G]|uniref:hypothetical protein n=1 Tax=Alkalihalobacillus sp. AL-G TaxID=2926399 RepID=UPI00272C70F0|nr:hypothetical protein [Alkalihalobacillus sp. AL-G]WLD94750.1 hypothetical protein MOJ78_07670 [Alkalihalobacillus sp. AL-G]